MSRPSHTPKASFSEVYNPMVYNNDRSQAFHHEATPYRTRLSGPQGYAPTQGYPGVHRSQGPVHVGLATGNVNNAPVNGNLNQTQGVTAAPQPSYSTPPFPPYANPPALLSHVPLSQPQLAHPSNGYPLHDERPSTQSSPRYHGRGPAPDRQYSYDEEEEARSPDHQDVHPADYYPHSPLQNHGYSEFPSPNLPSKSPQEYSRHENHDGHGRQSNNGFYPSPQAPPVESRNPFKRADTMPPAHASIPRQPPRQRATVEFTKDWVAGFSSPTDRHMQARARGLSMPQPEHFEHEKGPADMNWRAQSPNTSEGTGSSSGSPPLPVCWGRPLPSSSYATTHSRYTSMPEEPEDYLRVGKL